MNSHLSIHRVFLTVITVLCAATALVLLFLSMTPNHAMARPVKYWSAMEIEQKAEAVPVGVVERVEDVGPIPKEETRWNTPLRRRRATIRVLRFAPGKVPDGVREGDAILFEYPSIDWEKTWSAVNPPHFPRLSVGDVRALALRRKAGAEVGGQPVWEMIGEEALGLVLPCAREPFRPAGDVGTFREFLRYEHAGVLVNGSFCDIYPAIREGWAFVPDESEELLTLIEEGVGENETQWARIALAAYGALNRKLRPALRDTPKELEYQEDRSLFCYEALQGLPKHGLDEHMIRLALETYTEQPFVIAHILGGNYRNHPLAIDLVERELKEKSPEAVFLASIMVDNAEHPLVEPALKAVEEAMKEKDASGHYVFHGMASLIIKYGEEKHVECLAKEFREAKENNRTKYLALWGGVRPLVRHYNEKTLPFCAIAIGDEGLFYGGSYLPTGDGRFCDTAAETLQEVSGENFGYDRTQTIHERDQAVVQARLWLESKGFDMKDD